MAKLKFLGAVEGVTGSMFLLSTAKSQILLDCGLFQGRREEEAMNDEPLAVDLQKIDAVIISHAHLDHSGRLPLLVKQGYKGPVYMTRPTCDLVEVLLKDAAYLQLRDTQWENKRRLRAGLEKTEPLYTLEDVNEALGYFEGIAYHQRFKLTDDIELRFSDAGHILGSALVEIFIQEEKAKKLVFSGDLGNSQAALLRDPEFIQKADILLMESTYGDRDHRSLEETLVELEDIIQEASETGGNILIPSFAVGRTQEIIFRLGELFQKGKIKHQAIYLDSPMAIAVTAIYHRYQHMYNEEDKQVIHSQSRSQSNTHKTLHTFLPILRYSTTTEESMALNKIKKGIIIIAGSGMCNGGRIRHHLKHNLWRKKTHVIFVGYQAKGTPGRALIDGTKKFKVAGEEIAVKAKLHTLGGFSAHASQTQLIEWLNHFQEPKPKLYLVHGEAAAKAGLQEAVKKHGWAAEIPEKNQEIQF